jgi:hypothetical protein
LLVIRADGLTRAILGGGEACVRLNELALFFLEANLAQLIDQAPRRFESR